MEVLVLALVPRLHQTATLKVFNAGWKQKFLTSGGPFKFQSYDATAKNFTFVPNEKWWGNKPKLDSIVFRVIDDDAQPTALANGEIDLMEIGPSVDQYNKAKVIPGVDIRVAGGPNFRHITMNGESSVLQDVKVRQALAMGIDRTGDRKSPIGPAAGEPGLARQSHLHAEPGGLSGQLGDRGLQPGESEATAR